MFVKIYSVIFCYYGPHSYIKLTIVEEKWMLHIFLNHPRSGRRILVENVFVDFTESPKNFNTLALVQWGGFDKPHILLTMLDGYTLFLRASSCNILISVHQQVDFIFILDSRYDERGWCGIENCITGSHRLLKWLVVCLQRLDETCLCRDSFRVFKVVYENVAQWV